MSNLTQYIGDDKKNTISGVTFSFNNILNGHSIQFLKLSVQNMEGNITSQAAIFRLQGDESAA